MEDKREYILKIDWYTKIVLTLIAILLAGILAKPYIEPQVAKAVRRFDAEYYVQSNLDGSLTVYVDYYNTRSNPFYVKILNDEE